MLRRIMLLTAIAGLTAGFSFQAHALEAEKTTVYCADLRIEITTWDIEQMKVRRGSGVCAFATFTSSSSAHSFARKNFGGAGKPCACE